MSRRVVALTILNCSLVLGLVVTLQSPNNPKAQLKKALRKAEKARVVRHVRRFSSAKNGSRPRPEASTKWFRRIPLPIRI